MRGRKKTPTAVMEKKGAFKKHPERRPDGEPEPVRGIGPAPARLPAEVCAIWDEIVAEACPGVLGNSDRIALEMLATLLHRFRYGEPDGDIKPLAGVELTKLVALLAAFGMTPADRARIVVPKGGQRGNPFAEIMGGK